MLDNLPSTTSIAHALDVADADHWTRQPPKSDQARLRFLLTRHTGITATATSLHTTPATLHKILNDRHAPVAKSLHQAIANDTIRLWQPGVRRRLHHSIIRHHTHAVRVAFGAWFGYHSAKGSSDDGRHRRLTETIPAHYAAELLTARHLNAGEDELRRILGDAIGEAYFNVRPARGLSQVRLTDISYVEFFYWAAGTST